MPIPHTYRVIGKIGAGNSGEIYKAYQINLGKYVVLKKIKTEIKDFLNNRAEVDVLKNLRHSCLPQVLDFFEADGDVYTVMDFIPGNSFKDYLDSGTVFEEKSVIIWAKQIAATLGYLHSQKPPIIHSDLKPGNIMLTPEGNICLIDFNISATLDGDTAWVTGYTNGYAAPEQIEALHYNQNELDHSLWKTIDARADIYSLGATLYHIMTGRKPKPDENGNVSDIRLTGIKINDIFAHIIMKCLEPDPNRRYQSAEELLNDLKNIQTKDKRYKDLCAKQHMAYVLVAGLMIGSAALTISGYFKRDVGKQKNYESYVRQEAQCISSGDYQNFETYYEKATDLIPDRLDAYYQKALALNKQQQYGDSIDFINKVILSNDAILKSGSSLNDIYYLLGNSYERMENYENAAECYKKAIDIKPDNSAYYRDYAIAMAYTGNMEEAEKALETARENGLDSIDIDYVEGEISYNNGDYSGAKDIFADCIQKTDDDYLRMRAYIMECKCIDGQDDGVSGLDEKIQILEKARKELPKEYNIGILEQLAQTYSDLGNDTSDMSYYQEAAKVFEQIQSQGMGTYDTDYNLSVLYQNMQQYDQEETVLNQMLEKYGDNYKTYKALAYLEVAKQSQADNEGRDYTKFQEYYLKAKELYQSQPDNNANDMEMDNLQDLYEQAVANGWLSAS